MDVKKYKIDFLSADAHKWLLGPEGIGIFYCRQELAERIAPPLVGWKSVKNQFAFESPALSSRRTHYGSRKALRTSWEFSDSARPSAC